MKKGRREEGKKRIVWYFAKDKLVVNIGRLDSEKKVDMYDVIVFIIIFDIQRYKWKLQSF